MAEDERTRRWQRIASGDRDVDPIHALRSAITAVKATPRDQEVRRQLRALAAELGLWEPLAVLLLDEARAAVEQPRLAAAFYEELADCYENLDQPIETISAMEAVVAFEPDDVQHHDRLAWLYRKAGASVKAAQAFERVAALARDDRSRAALRAAGRLYRDSGKQDQAVRMYRAVVAKKPSDTEAWKALDEILSELGQWREVAQVRGELADRATGVDKAVLLRAQARALEQAGDVQSAANLVASAAGHAPEDVSGLVDYATVLAREGRGKEAADVLSQRITEAVSDGAPSANVAALRLRHVDVLDGMGDREGAANVLDKVLAGAPEYLPALEKLVQLSAKDDDPRVHAAALLRQASALAGTTEATALVIEAARRFRDGGDLRKAAHAFEQAVELSPDDDRLHEELEDARTALVVEIASVEAGNGDLAGAERRLKQILSHRPIHLDANLALVDLLEKTKRLPAAGEHLRNTLANALEDTPEELLAKLVHRYARVMTALGDTDEAHQLLHEAHHFDRRSLPITLALGESCFGRKLWREAAIHLGSLADHPDAPKHAAAVAAGLARAGQAEVRALKPANAAKHYEAAVRIDPKCGPAWHALAELATATNDMVRAADCLEREADASSGEQRVRLFDALGDLATQLLQDPARAERCWAAVLGEAPAPVLEKLVQLQRKRGATIERGATCERLGVVAEDAHAKKEFLDEAALAYATGGDNARARAVADRLIATYPLDPDSIYAATGIVLADGDHEFAAASLRRALGAWDAANNRGEGDARRAELWRRLGDAEKGRQNYRVALDAYQRAVNTDPSSDGALAARRGLIKLAAAFGRNENTSRLAIVEAEQEPADVIASARSLAKTGDADDAYALYELARALGVELLAEDEQFVDSHARRPMASDEAYAAHLTDAERRALVDDYDDGVIADLLTLLGEAQQLVCPDAKHALDHEALSDARRLTAQSEAAAAAIYPQIANALGGPATLLYANPTRSAPDLRLLLAAPPVVVLGPRLAAIRARSRSDVEQDVDADLRFRIGRIVELARPHRIFAAGTDPDVFAHLIAGLLHAFGPKGSTGSGESAERYIVTEAERLRQALPVSLRRRITERLANVTSLDPSAYIGACNRAADRAGLLACGHAGIAILAAGGPEIAHHVVELAASQKYLAARRKLRRK